ncbi:MAG: DivIVA domain-containing protein [Calditrichaceae bacterium]|nr:DivIVA domain-containing protein [Calditrichaceae bacterium]MBN2708240.1 DivIVA domain-containing protein [Calditrichaceae bacterium]RQV92262.1 MAG: DivIVA domain-containing protein [Calditrichota bacterium]
MKITPVEIRKQEFKKSMRGYDSVEVDTFLDMVAAEMEKLIEDYETSKKKEIALQTELSHYKDVEKTLKETLHNVQETTQQSKENSQKEASLIKREAEISAQQMIEKARANVRAMEQEVRTLEQQKESLVARLKHLLSSQLELIEVLSIDDKTKAVIKDKTRTISKPGEKPVQQDRTAAQRPVEQNVPKPPESKPAPQPKPVTPDIPPVKEVKNEDGSKNMFRDIFGDNLDVDDVLK